MVIVVVVVMWKADCCKTDRDSAHIHTIALKPSEASLSVFLSCRTKYDMVHTASVTYRQTWNNKNQSANLRIRHYMLLADLDQRTFF